MSSDSYGSAKSSGSISEGSGSSGSSFGSGSASGSTQGGSGSASDSGYVSDSGSGGASDSGSGSASFDIANIVWVDTSVGDPSVLDFDVVNTGTEPLNITLINGTAPGFDPIPATFALPVGSTVHVFASTEAGVDFTGSSVTVDSDIAGSKTFDLTP